MEENRRNQEEGRAGDDGQTAESWRQNEEGESEEAARDGGRAKAYEQPVNEVANSLEHIKLAVKQAVRPYVRGSALEGGDYEAWADDPDAEAVGAHQEQ